MQKGRKLEKFIHDGLAEIDKVDIRHLVLTDQAINIEPLSHQTREVAAAVQIVIRNKKKSRKNQRPIGQPGSKPGAASRLLFLLRTFLHCQSPNLCQ
ncbi:MAG: hypothetical protein BWY75_00422 [bacterium ADurb.Bin425]|nr:MAG: hypothetical protein BWY75_00422 [bacterium ADurb.Bin425]